MRYGLVLVCTNKWACIHLNQALNFNAKCDELAFKSRESIKIQKQKKSEYKHEHTHTEKTGSSSSPPAHSHPFSGTQNLFRKHLKNVDLFTIYNYNWAGKRVYFGDHHRFVVAIVYHLLKIFSSDPLVQIEDYLLSRIVLVKRAAAAATASNAFAPPLKYHLRLS